MTDTKELQRVIAEWSRATFGGDEDRTETYRVGRRWGMWAHLMKEHKELLDALTAGDLKKIRNELADCTVLLFDMAEISGIDIGEAMLEKLEVNKKRKWGKPDANGCVEHVDGD